MLAPYWIWECAVDADTCDRIIEHGLSQTLDAAAVNRGEEQLDLSVRRSSIAWIHEPWIKEMLFSLGHSINREAFGFDLYSGLGTFDVQFTQYAHSSGDKYDWHIDTVFAPQKPSDRKLSLIVQLSDPSDYSGGDLHIKLDHHSSEESLIGLPRGTLIVFPSFFLHCITPVTSGTRHSLVSWLEGPLWR